MSVIAYEDIGLANPAIGPRVDAAINAAERVGLPEARIPLGTIVTEMALSPKSNTAHIALDKAIEDIENGNVGNVPNHLKNPSTEYKYPHDYKGAYVVQQYLPDKIKNKKYYTPKDIGYEKQIKEIYTKLENLKKQKIVPPHYFLLCIFKSSSSLTHELSQQPNHLVNITHPYKFFLIL